MSINDNIVKVCGTVHELKGRCDRLESEIEWLREMVAVLMAKATQPIYSYPAMPMEQWIELMKRGPTCSDKEAEVKP